MAMNLRLRPDEEVALREESARSGLSQQEILRQALDQRLGLGAHSRQTKYPDGIIPPEEPPRYVEPQLTLAPGESVLDLIDREDRF
ncbi:hypothetical protein L2X99_16005 [Microbacterium sp. KUDC0406]|uniref:hypothetical protein n=1 Tax=Microbacterium sp. KUDC0406 TaxID=2909588 RepID=UPI001F2591F6|nr:hypothetical protein [Microbacterium sp. KUDC0406]UJP09860.1 hypothetical protein L2X99_16005 [Microbacterium sp. KUDC0406]